MTYTMTYKKDTILINAAAGTITGDTYGMKNIIKEEFDGIRWDGARKCWAMDSAAMVEVLNKLKDYFVRCYKLREVEAAPVAKQNIHTTHNGVCPHCGTYCYGDCTAS